MAPAQNINITDENTEMYTHKKFERKRIYAHKKFGTCLSWTPSLTAVDKLETSIKEKQNSPKNLPNIDNLQKGTNTDIFRPYALPDNTVKKRKHPELQSDLRNEESEMEFNKRFAYSSIWTTAAPSTPVFSTCETSFIINPYSMALNPFYHFQEYQFNPQALTLVMQKQRDALYMGEVLKEQGGDVNWYNLMGQ